MREKTQQRIAPLERIRHFNEFHTPLTREEQQTAGSPLYGLRRSLLPVRHERSKGMASAAARCTIWCRSGMIWSITGTGSRLIYACTRPTTSRNLPASVCPALCEKACTCGLNGEPVSTKENEMSDH